LILAGAVIARTAYGAAAERPNRSDVMTRLKRFAIAALAATTVTTGSLAVVPMASALPKVTCEERLHLYVYFWHLGWQYYALGDFSNAYHSWSKAEAYKRAGC
jgi:hypothetical protein